MNNLSLKYYPTSILFYIVCILIAVFIYIKYIIFTAFEINNYLDNNSIWDFCIEIIGLSGMLASALFIINRYFMAKWFLEILNIPNLKGNYKGTLISSYHIDDDPNKPNITRYIQMEISQNLNGFFVKTQFYDNQFSNDMSSTSISTSHDIQSQDNGEFVITYFYKNEGNKFHLDHKKYGLNHHDGIAIFLFNPKNKTLIGKYFNNSQERPSYGNINLTQKI